MWQMKSQFRLNLLEGFLALIVLMGYLALIYYLGTHMGPPGPVESAMIYLREHPAGFSQASMEGLGQRLKLSDQDFYNYLLCDDYWVKCLVLRNPYLKDSVALAAFRNMDEKGRSDFLCAMDQVGGMRGRLGQPMRDALREEVEDFFRASPYRFSSSSIDRLRTVGRLSDKDVEEFLVYGDFTVRLFVFNNVNVEVAPVLRVFKEASPQLRKALMVALRASSRWSYFSDAIRGQDEQLSKPVSWTERLLKHVIDIAQWVILLW